MYKYSAVRFFTLIPSFLAIFELLNFSKYVVTYIALLKTLVNPSKMLSKCWIVVILYTIIWSIYNNKNHESFMESVTYLPGNSLAISAHLFPYLLWASNINFSSLGLMGSFLISGSKWLCHLYVNNK